MREKLSGFTEEVDVDLWPGIEKGLRRRSAGRVIRRTFIGAAAAAACIAGGLLIFKGGDDNTIAAPSPIAVVSQQDPVSTPETVLPQTALADADAPAASAAAPRTRHASSPAVKATSDEVKPIAEQLEEFTASIAQADIPEQSQVQQPSETPAQSEPKTVEETRGDYDWIYDTDEEPSRRSTRIGLSSNLSAIASKGSFVADFGPQHVSSQSGRNAGESNFVPVSEDPFFYMPVTLGLQVRTPSFGRFSIGTGVNYTYLVSRYDVMVNKELFQDAYSQLHYVGIPLNLYFNFIEQDNFDAYAYVGAMGDKCVKSRYIYGSKSSTEKVGGIQMSASLGVGIEYRFADFLGIYVDPSISYFFNNSQPLSIRTSQPLQPKLELGLRFIL